MWIVVLILRTSAKAFAPSAVCMLLSVEKSTVLFEVILGQESHQSSHLVHQIEEKGHHIFDLSFRNESCKDVNIKNKEEIGWSGGNLRCSIRMKITEILRFRFDARQNLEELTYATLCVLVANSEPK